MKVTIKSMVYIGLCSVHAFVLCERWTWAYTKQFSCHELNESVKLKSEIIVAKKSVSPFTQLIVSWNAKRPQKGHFTFWIQGKDAHTNMWGSWHKMMEWGASIQCSYVSLPDSIAQHHHVRFEARSGKKMNGFRIKITAHNGADLCILHAITAAYSDMTLFKPEDAASYNTLKSIKIKKVPRKSQFMLKHAERHRLCSPTSCAILIEYFSHERCNMHTVACNMFDHGLDSYGSWPFNMAHAFELCQGRYWWRVIRMNSFKDLYSMLEHNHPVAISVRGYLPGAPKAYPDGHLMVVIGYDAATHTVICHDPACTSDRLSLRKYHLADFLRAWEKSYRLTYAVSERSL